MRPLPLGSFDVKRGDARPHQAADAIALPAGTPAWITPELVERTLRLWQPFYPQPMDIADALELLTSVDRLLGLCIAGRRPGS